jgi:hypothetical protein
MTIVGAAPFKQLAVIDTIALLPDAEHVASLDDTLLLVKSSNRLWALNEKSSITSAQHVNTLQPIEDLSPLGLSRNAELAVVAPVYSSGLRLQEGVGYLERLSIGTGTVDTLALLRSRFERRAGFEAGRLSSSAAQRRDPIYLDLRLFDQAIAFKDGWIAIARSSPYSVEWCPRRELCLPPVGIRHTRTKLTDAGKHAMLANEHLRSQFGQLTLRDTYGWPEFLPPFRSRFGGRRPEALLEGPDGDLVIERLSAGTKGRSYDVISRKGELRTFVLDTSLRIVAFGNDVALMAMRTQNGERLGLFTVSRER